MTSFKPFSQSVTRSVSHLVCSRR